jgi:hypothetical protein
VRDAVVIGAALAHRFGYGGHAWALLQYVLGFRALGFDVTVIDRLEHGMIRAEDAEAALDYLHRLLDDWAVPFCVLNQDGSPLSGLSRSEMLERTKAARFLLNVMGFVDDPEILASARRRVFLDIDPGFPQIWHELGLANVFKGHDDFVTVGRNVGHDQCGVPTCGERWLTIPHPVVLERCPVVEGGEAFTSVGSWRGPYAPVDYQGKILGLRVHEFRKFAALPRLVDAQFRIALDIDSADEPDVAMLERNGWNVVEPQDVSFDPAAYLAFIRGSLAEFTVAKGVYVHLRTGWLGDRTVAYLASGKPALVQDTALAAHYRVGEGLLAFSTLGEAIAGVRAIQGSYPKHARAARGLAEEEFEARRVLGRLLEELG